MRTKTLWNFTYLVAGLGFLTSIYTALESIDTSLQRTCSVTSFFSCAAVDASGHTSTLGIPDSAIGIAGFILILVVLALAERHPDDPRFFYVVLFFTTGAVAFASYFAYVELAIIHALCPVCTTAYTFAVLTWAGAIALTRRVRADASPPVPAGSGKPGSDGGSATG